MATLRKRPLKDRRRWYWQLNWIEDGKRYQRSLGTDDPKIAKQAKSEIERRLVLKWLGVSSGLPGREPLAKFVETYLAYCKTNKAPRTYEPT